MSRSKSNIAPPARRALWLAIVVASSAGAAPREPSLPAFSPAASWQAALRPWQRLDAAIGWMKPPQAPATSSPNAIVVTNCDDSGPGSLRDAVENAVDGSMIDLTQLDCSAITLTSGALAAAQESLSLTGPGSALLTVSGNDAQQVLVHSGSGTLSIANIAIAHGLNHQTNPSGGCIYSQGRVVLTSATVHDCVAESDDYHGLASGGGVFSHGIEATDTSIYSNTVSTLSPIPNLANGGGLTAYGAMVLTRSYIWGNRAVMCGGVSAPYGLSMSFTTIAANEAYAVGGACSGLVVSASAVVDIESSAIVDNEAAAEVGGLYLYGAPPPAPAMKLINSTVSGNTATSYYGGGVYSRYGVLQIANSTIAFNSAQTYAGLFADHEEIDLDSSIVANNSTDGSTGWDDIDGREVTITGASNLVTFSTLPLPNGTISADPMLLPLAFNGGLTKTHALDPASPAIDAGSNDLGIDFDQRGPGYARTVGAATDVGAFELDADQIFAGWFDE